MPEGFERPLAAVDFAVVEAVVLEQLLLQPALELAHGLLHGVQHRLGIAIGIDFLLVGGHIEQEIGNIAAGIGSNFLPFAPAHGD